MSNEQVTRLQQAVRTCDENGEEVGFRIVDMYHPGTAKWLQKHLWWASHNGCAVTFNLPTDAEIADYVSMMTQRLAQQFGGGTTSSSESSEEALSSKAA